MAFLSPQLTAAWQPLVLAQLSHLARQDRLHERRMSAAAASGTPQQQPPQGSQSQLVDKLLAAGVALTGRAEAALRAVDRRHFVRTYAGVPDTIAWQVQAPGQSMIHGHQATSCLLVSVVDTLACCAGHRAPHQLRPDDAILQCACQVPGAAGATRAAWRGSAGSGCRHVP